MTQFAEKESRSLIDELLTEQRLVTAVDRFAQKHESADFPLQRRYYRDLLPLQAPAAGEQYAFEVDLDKCSGCKACVAACHGLNGLEPGESWRSTGQLISNEAAEPFQQTITTACHHCIDPACLNGCPTLAYEKDPLTGIVRHLDDQCIGCQYCILKCPYEVPRYSSRLGIVRKCDMCAHRLAAGEAPACVQSCPSSAIRITVVEQEVLRQEHTLTETGDSFLPESPDPAYSLPTTRFVSSKNLPSNLRAGDADVIQPAAPHWPLVLMLVLTQAGIGGMWLELFSNYAQIQIEAGYRILNALCIFGGIGASILHLGRPLHAWRAFTGVWRSWLSREIVAFSFLSLGVLLHLALEALPFPNYSLAVSAYCSLAGAAALLCSMKVYIDTPREFWGWKRTVPSFLGTAMLLAFGAAAAFNPGTTNLFGGIAAIAFVKLALDLSIFRHLSDTPQTPLQRTAKLLAGPLIRVSLFRKFLLAVTAATSALIYAAVLPAQGPVAWLIFALLFVSEISGRYLFFRAVAQPKMPGGQI